MSELVLEVSRAELPWSGAVDGVPADGVPFDVPLDGPEADPGPLEGGGGLGVVCCGPLVSALTPVWTGAVMALTPLTAISHPEVNV